MNVESLLSPPLYVDSQIYRRNEQNMKLVCIYNERLREANAAFRLKRLPRSTHKAPFMNANMKFVLFVHRNF